MNASISFGMRSEEVEAPRLFSWANSSYVQKMVCLRLLITFRYYRPEKTRVKR